MVTQLFENHPEIIALMSNLPDGNMRIGVDEKGNIIRSANRDDFFSRNKIPRQKTVGIILDHGNNVVIVSKKYSSGIVPVRADALVTAVKDSHLFLTVADCYPVFFYDPVKKIIAVSHAGWKGIVSGIISETIKSMEELGSQSQNICVSVGPGICQRCYDFARIDLPMLRNYNQAKYILDILDNLDKVRINLEKMIEDILKTSSVKEVHFSRECTCCHPEKYFSARRQKMSPPETMMAVIGMK
jgi:YfiH family protein